MLDFLKQRVLRGFVRRINNLKITAMAARVAQRAAGRSGQPVIFFKASTGIDDLSWNSAFHLLASWALRLRGVPVKYFACNSGMSHCVLGTNYDFPRKAPPCRSCVHQSQTLYTGADVHWFGLDRDSELEAALVGRSLQELISFEWKLQRPITPQTMTIPLGALCLPGLRWILRMHHLDDNEDTRYLLREYILSAWNVARQFAVFLDQSRPRAVVVFNGQFFPEAVARFLAQAGGIRVITHEVGLQAGSAFFTTGEATAYPIRIPEEFELSSAQNARLDAYLEKRFQGEFSMAGVKFWPSMTSLDESFLQRASGFKQIVPVFTNVIFDTSQPHANTVFEDMFQWLDLVMAAIRVHPETMFVIRAHPDELRVRKASRETVAAWVAASGAYKAPNVVFVAPREGLSSYELILRSKFVMVYNSTIGLEASILGVPVLCAGKARFTQYPTVFFPQSVEEYATRAESFLNAEHIDVPAAFKRNARRFLYYQLFRASLPFEDFLTPSVRTTQTRLRSFGVEKLSPESSPAMKAILEGILEGGSFLAEESPPQNGKIRP